MKKVNTTEPAKINGTAIPTGKKKKLIYSGMNLKAILDVTDDAIIVYDKDLKLITCNNSFDKLVKEFGQKSFTKHFNLFDLTTPDRKEILRKKIDIVLKGEIVN